MMRFVVILPFVYSYVASKEDWPRAYQLMQDLRRAVPRVNLSFYVNLTIIEASGLEHEMGADMGQLFIVVCSFRLCTAR